MTHQGRKRTIRIELTAEQQEQVKRATGKGGSAPEMTPEALEERVAPVMFNPKEYTIT